MEKDPAKRFQTADEMRTALLALDPAAATAPAQAASHTPVPAAAPARGATRAPTPAPAPRPAQRSRLVFWAFAGAVVIAAAGGGAVAFFARQSVADRKGHPETISPAQAQVQTPAPLAPPASAPVTATATPPSAHPERSVAAGGAESKGTPTATPPSAHPERSVAAGGAESKGTPTVTPTPAPTPAPTAKKVPASVAKRDPSKAVALYKKAEARRAGQDIDGAIKLYLAAESSDPDLADVQKKLALCYQLKGDTRRAAVRYRRYLATAPPDAERVRAILSTLE